MKGQFFIISTVIMITALILIMKYLYDYGKVDLSNVEKMQELNYIGDIRNTLNTTVHIACTNGEDAEANLILAEQNLKERLLERGMILEVSHSGVGCASMAAGDINFKIRSNTFYVENSFSV